MANECSQHLRQHKFANVAEFRGHRAWLADQVSRGLLNVVECSLPLEEAILERKRIRDDTEAWVFECSICKARFELTVDNYHGGAQWRQFAPGEGSYFDFLRKVSEAQRRHDLSIKTINDR